MGFGAKPQARSQGRQPPIISPFPSGRGWGIGIENLHYIDFFDKLSPLVFEGTQNRKMKEIFKKVFSYAAFCGIINIYAYMR